MNGLKLPTLYLRQQLQYQFSSFIFCLSVYACLAQGLNRDLGGIYK